MSVDEKAWREKFAEAARKDPRISGEGLTLTGVDCYGAMNAPQRIIRVTLGENSVLIDADLLRVLLDNANKEALDFF